MNVDITINHKSLDALVTFEVENFKDKVSFMDSVAIITMVAGDYHLDPELDVETLVSIVDQARSKQARKVEFLIGEEGIEAEIIS